MAVLNRSQNRSYFRFLLQQNRRLMMVYSFVLLLTFPILCVSFQYVSDITGLVSMGKVLNICIVLAASLFIPLLLYRFTTSKRSLDVFHSLPIQKEYLFQINYIVGIIMVLLPLWLSWGCGLLAAAIFRMPQALSFLELSSLLQLSIAVLLCYSITVFTKANCGTTVDAFIYTIASHLIPILAFAAYYVYCHDMLLGFNEPFSADFFYYLSAIPFLFSHALVSNTHYMPSLLVTLYYTAIILLLYVMSSHLFVNHKSEKTEMPFTNQYFFPIMSFLSMIIASVLIHSITNNLFSFYNIQTGNYIFPLLVGGVLYLILDVIANRGFKYFKKTMFRVCMIWLVILVLLLPARYTQGFGYVKRSPDIDSVESVTMRLPYPIGRYMNLSDVTATFIDAESIALLRSLHQEIIVQYKAYDYAVRNFIYEDTHRSYAQGFPFTVAHWSGVIDFSYDLGLTTLQRQYTVNTHWMKPLLSLTTHAALVEARYPFIAKPESVIDVVSVDLWDVLDTSVIRVSNSMLDYAILAQNLLADMQTETTAQFYRSNQAPLAYMKLQVTYQRDVYSTNAAVASFDIPIKAHYTRTRAYLEGLQLMYPATDLTELGTRQMVLLYPDAENSEMFYFTDHETYIENGDVTRLQYQQLTARQTEALLRLAQPFAMLDTPGMLLVVNDDGSTRSLLIPAEYAAEVQSITADIPMQILESSIYNILK